jgi:hypothetical protein
MTGQCDLLNPGGSGCPGAPVASVVLNLTDAAGMAIPAATIAFTVNGGLSYGGSCNGDCNAVLLAQDIVGRFDIQVAAVGFVTATKSVDVVAEQGGCHPVTQFVTIKMDKDTTVGVLFGVWSTQTFAGRNVLRFGSHGEILGAIFFNQRAGGDGNWYISYNNHAIKGTAGQPITPAAADDPTRTGQVFNFNAVTQGVLTGFNDATMSGDFNTLSGILAGQAITYSRLPDSQIPDAIRDP